MIVSARNLTKRFYNELIFKKLSQDFETGGSYAIIGPNGSGKSTFIKVLTGIIPATSGDLQYIDNHGKQLQIDDWFRHIVFVSPYLELLEEFTLIEFLRFHAKFKPLVPEVTIDHIIEQAFLKGAENKQIHFFSSGMKQRLKLTMAFYFENDIVFLDEPTTNLDDQGKEWYLENIKSLLDTRLLFIASNQLMEYEMCTKKVNILDYK